MLKQPVVVRVQRKLQQGLTIVEYAVAGGLIAASVAAAFVLLGGRVDTIIRSIVTVLGG